MNLEMIGGASSRLSSGPVDVAPLLDAPFATPATYRLLTAGELLMNLTGQTATATIAVPYERYHEFDRYLYAYAHMISDHCETIAIVPTKTPGTYRRLNIVGESKGKDWIVNLLDRRNLKTDCFDYAGRLGQLTLRTVINATEHGRYFDARYKDVPFSHAKATSIEEIAAITRAIVALFDRHFDEVRQVKFFAGDDDQQQCWQVYLRARKAYILTDNIAERLLDFTVKVLDPRGYNYEHSNGPRNRLSSYEKVGERLTIAFPDDSESSTLKIAKRVQTSARREAAKATISAFLVKHKANKRLVADFEKVCAESAAKDRDIGFA